MERSSGAAPSLNGGGSGPEGDALFTVHVEPSRGRASVVAIAGELDLSTIPRMESPLLEQIRQRSAVVVDLSQLSFIDSCGIGVLFRASRESNGVPMHVVVAEGSQVERIFEIAGVNGALPVHRDREAALAALGEG
jgi:anti-sigma B factor antagonist